MTEAWYWIKSWWWWASYLVRPYDMLADRRRWFWQPAQHCGGPTLLFLCDCPYHPCEHNPRKP